MRIKAISFLLLPAVVVSGLLYFQPSERHEHSESPDVAQDWFYLQRAYPFDSIPSHLVDVARKQALHLRNLYRGILSGSWVEKGPFNIGGRVTSIDGVSDSLIYVGTANGGLFRMVRSGSSYIFESLTDGLPSLSVGDVTVDPHNPATVYLGLGEVNASGDSYQGDGIYVSRDGGNTWEYLGLREGKYIADIVVHPYDSSILYACVTGGLYSSDTVRGVFRSSDGGRTWEHVLFVSDSTACIDLVVVPSGLDVRIYAAMWERKRGPGYRHFGGPTSGIYRSMDGGDTWEELTSGLPDAAGRIGITAPTSDTLYALYCDSMGYYFDGVYKSTDGGDSWSRLSSSPDPYYFGSYYCWWFGNIYAQPGNPDVVYALGLDLWRTADGGASWQRITYMADWFDVHVDQHAIWVSPSDSSFVVLGNDGGVYVSTDWGANFSHLKGLPATQYYRIEHDPYTGRIFGGTQDNGTHRSGNPDWEIIYGGDGFWVRVRRDSPNIVFAEYQYGGLGRSRQWGDPGTFEYIDYDFSSDRSNWNTPYILNPLRENVMYLGTYRVWKSTDAGDNWTPISGDLTSGGTISYLDICRADTSIILAGTVEGRLWKYDGNAWTELTKPPLPPRYLTSIRFDDTSCDTFYVSFSGYFWDERSHHVYATYDGGDSFVDLGYNLPDAPVNSLEYYRGILIAGTDFGVYALLDSVWIPLGSNLPMSPVFHLTVSTDTLYAGTHGRGIWAYGLYDLVFAREVARPVSVSFDGREFILSPSMRGKILEIYDISGRRVRGMRVESNRVSVDLPPGTYIYSIGGERGKIVVR